MMLIRAAVISLMLTGTAMAQNRDQALDRAGNIASQPARDVGIAKTEIPPLLQKTTEAPYAMPASRTCKGLNASIGELTAVLGPDFTTGTENNQSRTGKILEFGGKAVVNSLIPFRSLVREVTGAAPAERRLEAAIATGVARRGFLRGMATAKGCKITG